MEKFVVLGIQRTGTTLIRTTLNSHPKVLCAGEVFMVRKIGRSAYPGEDGYPAYLKDSPKRWLKHYLQRSANTFSYLDHLYSLNGYKAIGFKFMTSHFKRFPAVVPYIVDNQIKVINVVRENVLKTLLSRRTAERRRLYHTTKTISQSKIELATSSLLSDLARIQQDGQRWEKLLGDYDHYFKVSYENFMRNKQQESKRMLDFLDVDFAVVESDLVKINPDNLDALIKNYNEVKEKLTGTAFEYCLN